VNRETVRQALRKLGITQAELARAAGRSEAAVSRQLNGGLPLTRRVANAAENLVAQRGADAATFILNLAELRLCLIARRQEAEGDGNA